MPTADSIKLIECPRDAWQGLKGQVPTDLKVSYLQALISVGFKHIDAVSFVSPNVVGIPADQMNRVYGEYEERLRRSGE